MGSILSCVPTDIIDTDFTNQMTAAIAETIVSIPIAYKLERERIIDEMRQASPQPYQGLLFIDYPTLNNAEVSALAHQNVTSDQVKQQIANQVTILLQPEINKKLAGLNPCALWIASKVIETAIETAVNQAIDLIEFRDNNISTTTAPVNNNILTPTTSNNSNKLTETTSSNNNILTTTISNSR